MFQNHKSTVSASIILITSAVIFQVISCEKPKIVFYTCFSRNISYFQASNENEATPLSQSQVEVEDFFQEFEKNLYPKEKIVGVFARGLWLFYGQKYYNWDKEKNTEILNNETETEIPVEWVYGNSTSDILHKFTNKGIKDRIGSFRYIGDINDINKGGVALFMGKYFSGPEYFVTRSSWVHLPFAKSKSSIVVGNSDTWTYFTRIRNINQQTLCIVPNNSNVENSSSPTLLPEYNSNELTRILRHLSSIRKGPCGVYDQIYNNTATNTISL